MSPGEQRAALQELEKRLAFNTVSDTVKYAREQWGWSAHRARKYIDWTFRRWQKEDEIDRRNLKAKATRRLLDSLERARARGAWNAVVQLETQLARIQGTEEPIAIKVDHTLGEATSAMLAGMDDAALLAIAREFDALQAKAKLAELAHAPTHAHAHVQDAEFEDVSMVVKEQEPHTDKPSA